MAFYRQALKCSNSRFVFELFELRAFQTKLEKARSSTSALISNYWIYDLDIYPFAKTDIGSGYISKNLQLHHIISISKIAPINTHFWQVFLKYFACFCALRADTLNKSRHSFINFWLQLYIYAMRWSAYVSFQSTAIDFINTRLLEVYNWKDKYFLKQKLTENRDMDLDMIYIRCQIWI